MENRREFLKYLAGLTASMMLPYDSLPLDKNRDRLGKILPKRILGKTGEEVTMLGVGGYHVGWTTERDAQAVIEVALEGGVRFFDSAESYGPHTSEIRYGKYLTPKYRDLVFLMTKSTAKDAQSLREHLEGSLKRLNTDYLDLWQVHAVQDPDDVDDRIENGVFEVMMEAKESGKARYIGFTGHNDPKAHLRVLEQTSESRIFDTIQMPVNVVDANLDHFVQGVLPEAMKQELGVLAMKTMADGRFFPEKKRLDEIQWTTDDPVVPDRMGIHEALYFAWSLPISVLITGAENEGFIKEKIQLAKEFEALTEQQREDLVNKVADIAEKGEVEYYKG